MRETTNSAAGTSKEAGMKLVKVQIREASDMDIYKERITDRLYQAADKSFIVYRMRHREHNRNFNACNEFCWKATWYASIKGGRRIHGTTMGGVVRRAELVVA